MADLKPCPFCGHPKSRLSYKREYCEDGNGEVAVRYQVYRRCNRCGARSGYVFTDPQRWDMHPMCDWAESFRKAADDKWNRRDGGRDE